MGNQGTALSRLRQQAAIVKSGVLGPIKEVHVWTNRPIWPQGGPRPEPSTPPDHINWDLFLGPAPERPYAEGYHPFAWRGWWDFGTGAIGDMACHTANMLYMALKPGLPTRVAAEAGDVNPETCPSFAHVTLTFPTATVHWYEGKKDGKNVLPAAELVKGQGKRDKGFAIYFETEGRLLITRKLSGQFPNYEMVMPKDNDKAAIFDLEEMRSAVRRMSLIADDRTHTGQKHLHLTGRWPLADGQRLTLDLLRKQGLGDEGYLRAWGFSVGYDWPRWFLRLTRDQKQNFSAIDATRLQVGLRF